MTAANELAALGLVWRSPLLVLASAWHARAALRGHPLPGRAARIGLTLIIIVGVLLSYRTLNGLAAGATLLAAMSAAKLFEARTSRDWQVLNGATLFLLMAACLDRQQLWRLPVYALCLWLCTSSLRGLAGGAALPAGTLLRESARQLLYAAPLAAILFLFFPRLPGALWALPGEGTAITGLGDEMSPGDIARLVESDEPALRVRFAGALPPARERYWRGPVLHDFDGATWRRHRGAPAPVGALVLSGPAYRYSATLEANAHSTMIALEMSRPPPLPGVQYTDDFQLLSQRPFNQAQSYELTAYPGALRPAELTAGLRELDLALPANRNPRARALASRLRAVAGDDSAYVTAALDFFKRGGLRIHADAPAPGREFNRRTVVFHPSGVLRPLRFGLCGLDARRRRAGAGRHRLPGRRMESDRPLPDRAPVRRARLGGSVVGRARMATRRSHRGRLAAAPEPGAVRFRRGRRRQR